MSTCKNDTQIDHSQCVLITYPSEKPCQTSTTCTDYNMKEETKWTCILYFQHGNQSHAALLTEISALKYDC